MTNRRDKSVKGASVISGHRMEPDLAKRLTEYARENFTDDRGYADVARAARFLLRTSLGLLERDDHGPLPLNTRGLRVEQGLFDAIERYQGQQGLPSPIGTARHLMRLGLGMRADVSLQREARFAEIASAKRGLMEE